MGADSQAQRVLDGKVAAALREVINRECMENGSNTPDFILATYLLDCLMAFDRATNERERWYGRLGRKEITGDAPQRPG